MRELRRKMLLTLFGLLSILVWLIVGVFDFQDYLSVQNELQDSLMQIADLTQEIWNPTAIGPFREQDTKEEEDAPRIDLLYENPVYLVLVNKSGVAVQAYTSTYGETNLDEVVQEAEKIAADHKSNSIHIGNLFTDSFVWNHPAPHAVILVETGAIRHELVRHLFISIVIGLGFEVILYLVCRKTTAWMIHPIEETFDKQRQFIADASHELKTPVAVILANAEAMEQDPNPKWLSNIEEEAGRMSGLITDLLDLTRNEQQEFHPVEVDLSRLVQKQCLIQEAVMFEKHIELTEEIEPDLKVLGQASSLEQVIAILLDNAAAHSTGKIIVALHRKGKETVLDVSNTGKPIPPEDRERIFERFYRADESRNRGAGRYGLGLAIAKSIVDRHKGHIEVFCKDGLTTFQITLKSI